jgi:hypothetical protein
MTIHQSNFLDMKRGKFETDLEGFESILTELVAFFDRLTADTRPGASLVLVPRDVQGARHRMWCVERRTAAWSADLAYVEAEQATSHKSWVNLRFSTAAILYYSKNRSDTDFAFVDWLWTRLERRLGEPELATTRAQSETNRAENQIVAKPVLISTRRKVIIGLLLILSIAIVLIALTLSVVWGVLPYQFAQNLFYIGLAILAATTILAAWNNILSLVEKLFNRS